MPSTPFSAAWPVLDGFVTLLLTTMLIAGLVLAYLLPAIPFIRFLFGILTWLVTVIEALLAVTIFLAAHVTREDSERLLNGSTRLGWLFLPGLVLRPVLMVFGLVLGLLRLQGRHLPSQTRPGCRSCRRRTPRPQPRRWPSWRCWRSTPSSPTAPPTPPSS